MSSPVCTSVMARFYLFRVIQEAVSVDFFIMSFEG